MARSGMEQQKFIQPLPRLNGLDVARALAVFGMLAAHVGPTGLAGLAGGVFNFSHGRASLLFVILAGIGLGFIAQSRSGRVREKILWRALVLMVLGLGLQMFPHGIAVILQFYAVLFAIGLLLIRMSTRSLAILCASVLLLGPLIFVTGQSLLPGVFNRHNVGFGTTPGMIVSGLLLTGSYPAVTWLGPFCLGLLLSRARLRDRDFQWRLVYWGGMLLAVTQALSLLLEQWLDYPPYQSFYQLIYIRPHNQTHLWLLNGTGAALVGLGLSCRLPVQKLPLAWLLLHSGRLAFTIYVVQLLAFALFPTALRAVSMADGLLKTAAVVLVTLAAVALWSRVRWPGPLEWLMRRPFYSPGTPGK